jgi:Carboxypeptidase regulatory-like domain/TonB dependent receptor-like, beta-barrel
MRRHLTGAVLFLLLACVPALAQQTTGTISGRVLDEQGNAIPGVSITARNEATGFTRTESTNVEGIYRLAALPVGIYEVKAALPGFSTVAKKDIEVAVALVQAIDFALKVVALAETVDVTGATPLVVTTSPSVGGVVNPIRIESLPLNGRQFANLAATIPGVGLGFHTDATKSTQFSPQINGGNGRNVNYLIDGGDNNDDTVGGLLQLFPLEAIQEFNFQTSNYKAEYGRSVGGVMNVVTKSGTNVWSGSAFEFLRDRALNAESHSERTAVDSRGQPVGKQDYRRNQFGGSFGGPLTHDKAHFFVAAERTKADAFQAVNTGGLFPRFDGSFPTEYVERLFTGKATRNLNARQFVSGRYGHNSNTQPYGTSAVNPPNNWATSDNRFNSFNLNHNWVLSGARLNEFIFQYADFRNQITSASSAPNEVFPSGVTLGANSNTPQTTEQHKFQFRDDFSWHVYRGGLGHDFKAGVNFINEPHLFTTFNGGRRIVVYTHATNDLDGPISSVSFSDGDAAANLPMKQLGMYIQDDWRLNGRLTLNLGLRYDVMTGYQIDQSADPNFVVLQGAGRSGRLNGLIGFEDFGKDPREDYNNIQPRIGLVFDVRGQGHDVVRASWGIYTDVGYTSSNILIGAADASPLGFGPTFAASNPNGLRNPDGSFFRAGQPLSNIANLNEVRPGSKPLFGSGPISPRLEQPESRQSVFGWTHQINGSTIVNADYVHIDGRKLNIRPQLNTRPNGGPFRLADLALSPNNTSLRPSISRGISQYDALILSTRRRWSKGMDFNISYTLARSRSNIGDSSDALDTSLIQDALNPFDDPRVFAPNRLTDARHRVTASAVVEVPGAVQVSPIWIFRSALPVAIIQGLDLNNDFTNNDIPDRAFSFNPGSPANPIDIGACETWQCGRGYRFSQLNLRVARRFKIGVRTQVEAIGEVFNLFNSENPDGFVTRRYTGTTASPAPNPTFMQPTTFAGDFRQPEQRVGQLGLRFTF